MMTEMKKKVISDDETDTILRFVRVFPNFHFVKIINFARKSWYENHSPFHM